MFIFVQKGLVLGAYHDEHTGEGWHRVDTAPDEIYTSEGIPLYAWDMETVVPRPTEDVEADRLTAQPDVGSTRLGLDVIEKILVSVAAQVMTDEQAQTHKQVWPRWTAGAAYDKDALAAYDGQLYRCIQGHTAQADWAPDKVPALWRRIGDEDGGTKDIQEWVQPMGAHDAYEKGALVNYHGKRWMSMADGNVWEPGVYGWDESDTSAS